MVVDASDLVSSNKNSRIRVLHVDDDPNILEISKQIMMDIDASFEFDSACCVDEAFKKLSIIHYDAVISDYEMPQKDGLQFLTELRKQNNSIPFVLFTGKGREEVAIKALNLGASGYFNKQGSPETVYGELAYGLKAAVARHNAELALIESQSSMRSIVDSTSDMIWSVSCDDFALLDFNRSFEEYFLNENELVVKVGMRPENLFSIAEFEEWREFYKRALNDGPYSTTYEVNMCKRVFQLSFNVIRQEEKVFGISVFGKDITEQMQTEKLLLENEDRLRKAQAIAHVGNWELDLQTQKVRASEEAFKIYGIERSNDFLPLALVQQVVLPEYRPNLNLALQELILSNKKYDLEFKIRRPDNGQERFIHSVAELVFDQNKTPIRVNGVIQDISERKKSEQALIESEENYKNLINGMDESAWVVDFDGNFLEVNNAAVEMLEYSKEELQLLGIKGIDNYLAPEQVKVIMGRVVSVGTQVFETVHTAKDGKKIPVEISSSLINYKGKQAILAIARNIAERKKAEQSLMENEEKFRTLAEQSPNMIFINHGNRVVYANKKCEEITGYSREELCSPDFNILSLNPPEYADTIKLAYGKHMKGENVPPYEYILITRNGKRLNAIINTALIEFNGDKAILGIVTDITELKKTQETMRKSEERYRELANFLPVIVFETDLTGKITFFNTRAFELTGVTPEEVEKGSNIVSFVSPQERERAIENMEKSMAGEEHGANEYTLVRKNGTTYPALVRTNPIISENKVIGIRGLLIDITERKKTEMDLKESRDKLELMNEKLRVVGNLSRHDVRNKLSAVNGYTYLLKKKHRDQADILEDLSKIEQVVADSAKIFEFAKMYEQLGVEELANVDVGKAVDDAVVLFSGLTIKVVNDCHGISVLADSFLRQMFYNFVDNTKKYGVKATTIKVYCEKETSDGLRLIYEDDGVGISTENKSKLFKEGFSTGASSGFGLFFIKKMMDVYGWAITEEGKPGRGAKFILTIPNK